MSPKTETTYEQYQRSRQGVPKKTDKSYEEYMSERFPDDTFELSQPAEMPTRVESVSPQDPARRKETDRKYSGLV
jgi:hypothetical protein